MWCVLNFQQSMLTYVQGVTVRGGMCHLSETPILLAAKACLMASNRDWNRSLTARKRSRSSAWMVWERHSWPLSLPTVSENDGRFFGFQSTACPIFRQHTTRWPRSFAFQAVKRMVIISWNHYKHTSVMRALAHGCWYWIMPMILACGILQFPWNQDKSAWSIIGQKALRYSLSSPPATGR